MLKIIRYHIDHTENIKDIIFECEEGYERPAWLHISSNNFKASFITIATENVTSILYKRFTVNFYYPYDFTKEEEARFYKHFAQFYDEFTLKNNLPMAQFILAKIKSLNISQNSSILDLGAGTGIFSDLAISNGYSNIELYDISEAMLKVAKTKRNLEDKKIYVGDITKDHLENKYDVVISIMMFDAITDADLPKVLEKIKNCINPNGYLLLIEDKNREEFNKHFEQVDKGYMTINKEKNFNKWYYIGKKSSQHRTQ